MKIIAIGMNYPLHCKELDADEPLPTRTGYVYETGLCLAEGQQAVFYS